MRTKILNIRSSNLKCIKTNNTNKAFNDAIPNATKTERKPRSRLATVTVNDVSVTNVNQTKM